MGAAEYSFAGLDEWEKELSRAIESQFPEEFNKMVYSIAEDLWGRVIEKTPFDTGHLRNEWKIGDMVRRGNEYYIEVYNNVEYAEPVEYGHRTRGGGFVPGCHMMEVSLQEVQRRLPGYLREWLAGFLNTHEVV